MTNRLHNPLFWVSRHVFLSTTLLALLVYLFTLAPDLIWAHFGGDGGELITAAVTLGVPHPPGYPTYVLLGKFISFIPIGTAVFRFNLFSAVCVALAAGVVAVVSGQYSVGSKLNTDYRLLNTDYWSLITGLTFAFTSFVWGQAVIAEVYGLNVLLVALFLWALLGERPYPLTGLLLGLSLTTHLTSAFLIPLALALVPTRNWPKLGVGLLAGLTPFLLLPLFAYGSSPVVWGNPTTWQGWWWLVSGRIYHPNAFALPAAQWLPRLREWALLAAGGMASLQVCKWQGASNKPANLLTCKPTYLLLATFFLYFLYAFFYNTLDAAALLLPGVLLLVLLLAPILRQLGRWGWLLPLALLLLNFNGQNLRGDAGVRPFAITVLEEAPNEAILLTPGNESIFALWYFQTVEGLRPDVILVDKNLFAFDWYRARLQAQHPDLRHLSVDDLEGFRQANGGQRAILTVDLWEKMEIEN
ncbi:MAG: DUF2723 domain-containing protein [Anaerolineales bacterium]|nr:DUF2723 domain-containing protein [Anaerolineales bacterium]